MSDSIVSDSPMTQPPSAGTPQHLHHEIDEATGELKLKVNPKNILESLRHLRIDISRIKDVQSGAKSKCGGQGTVVPSILVPEGAPNEEQASNTTNNFVAVKKLRSGEDQDWNRVITPFAYELQMLNAISHENIVEAIGFVEDAEIGVAWMLFNWEANGNMRELVATAKLEIPERISLVNDVARGLAHLHGMDPPICHADLKSLNILINSEFRAVITDFGSARAMTNENPNEVTRAESPSAGQRAREAVLDKTMKIQVESSCFTLTGQRGTVRWSAPELLEGIRPNLSTDIWAFGWICWEAITGNFPFYEQGESSGQDVQIILSILAGELPTLRNNSELSQIQVLCNLMESCWNLDPAGRPLALRCEQILELMNPVIPQRRKPGLTEETYSSGLLRALGLVHKDNSRMDEAMNYFARSLKMAEITGNSAEVAIALHLIGDIHRLLGEYSKAEECYVQALHAFTQIGDELGMANAVRSLGDVHQLRGRYTKAEECYVQARNAFIQIGDQLGTANAVRSLGDVHQFRGEYTKAEECYVQARDAFTQIGDELGMANAVTSLGEVHQFRGEYTKAEECYVQARDAFIQIGSQLGTANAVTSLGDVHQFRGEYTKAEECYVQARDAFTQIGDELGSANASIGLGRLYQGLKEYGKAKESFLVAHKFASTIKYQWALDESVKGLEEIAREQNK